MSPTHTRTPFNREHENTVGRMEHVLYARNMIGQVGTDAVDESIIADVLTDTDSAFSSDPR
jgi:hypothetical protein